MAPTHKWARADLFRFVGMGCLMLPPRPDGEPNQISLRRRFQQAQSRSALCGSMGSEPTELQDPTAR
jgi:hypothetical protein